MIASSGWSLKDLAGATALRSTALTAEVGLAVVLTPLVYRRLGEADHGLWLLVLSQVAPLGLLDLDIHDSVLRAVIAAQSDAAPHLKAVRAIALVIAVGVARIGAIAAIGRGQQGLVAVVGLTSDERNTGRHHAAEWSTVVHSATIEPLRR